MKEKKKEQIERLKECLKMILSFLLRTKKLPKEKPLKRILVVARCIVSDIGVDTNMLLS